MGLCTTNGQCVSYGFNLEDIIEQLLRITEACDYMPVIKCEGVFCAVCLGDNFKGPHWLDSMIVNLQSYYQQT